jgi:hypothetical protein
MPVSLNAIAGRAALAVIMVIAAACSPKQIPPMSVTDLMEDRVTLDGVLLKCSQNPGRARSDIECLNARTAIDRLANRVDPAEDAKRSEEFEHNRERLRLLQDKLRQDQEAKTKVDAYHLPLVPVEPPPAESSVPQPSSDSNPPVARESNP